MKRSLKIAVGLVTSLLLSLVVASPAGAEVIRLDVDGPCPDGYPIKHQISDARTGVTYFNCMSQYQWDIEMIGGETHAKWLASGQTYDATQDIANWKAERAAIEKLRTDTEALAKSEAQKYPNTQICKAYNYTSIYNGSGGGSYCTIHTETVDVSVQPVTNNPVESIQPASVSVMSVASATVEAIPTVVEIPAATQVTAKYLSNTTKAVKKLKKMKYTFPKGPKGTSVNVAKVSGDSCFVTGRTVYLGKNSECSVAVTVTKKGVIQGVRALTFVR